MAVDDYYNIVIRSVSQDPKRGVATASDQDE